MRLLVFFFMTPPCCGESLLQDWYWYCFAPYRRAFVPELDLFVRLR